MPYKYLRPDHIVGLPLGITLSHPSNMSRESLQAVYENMSSIKFVGMLLVKMHVQYIM